MQIEHLILRVSFVKHKQYLFLKNKEYDIIFKLGVVATKDHIML